MKKLIRKYLFAFVAVLMTASIGYASSCANYCTPMKTDVTAVGSSMQSHHMDMASMEHAGMEHSSGHNEDTSSSALSCDEDYVVNTKTVKVSPIVTDLEFVVLGVETKTLDIELLTISSFANIDVQGTTLPIYIQNSTFLI